MAVSLGVWRHLDQRTDQAQESLVLRSFGVAAQKLAQLDM
jgi:hypothetical protein